MGAPRLALLFLASAAGLSLAQVAEGHAPVVRREAEVTAHGPLISHVLKPEPAPREKVSGFESEWQQFALAEDGTPDLQTIIAQGDSFARGRATPKWANAGLAEENMLTAFDREMAHQNIDASDMRARLEEHTASVPEHTATCCDICCNPTTSTCCDGSCHDFCCGGKFYCHNPSQAGGNPAEYAASKGGIVCPSGFKIGAICQAIETTMSVSGGGGSWSDTSTAPPIPDPTPLWRDPFAFKYYKLTPLKVRSVMTADAVSIAELKLWSFSTLIPRADMVAYNPMGDSPAGQSAMKAIDGHNNNAWTDAHMGPLMIILPYHIVATGFAFVTAPDKKERDPVQWYWEGSNDLKNWTMLIGQLSDAPSVSESRQFETDMFTWKIDCLLSDWHGWTECSVECSGGNRTRVRKIQRHSSNGGECKDALVQDSLCNEKPCAGSEIEIKAGAPSGAGLSPLLWAMLAVATGWRAMA